VNAFRKDTAEPAIVTGLRSIGWSVLVLSSYGVSCDLLVGAGGGLAVPGPAAPWPWSQLDGVAVLLEVKSDDAAPLTPAETTLLGEWRGPRAVVSTLDDAVAAVSAVLGGGR
jgi:hypothetical protein